MTVQQHSLIGYDVNATRAGFEEGLAYEHKVEFIIEHIKGLLRSDYALAIGFSGGKTPAS